MLMRLEWVKKEQQLILLGLEGVKVGQRTAQKDSFSWNKVFHCILNYRKG